MKLIASDICKSFGKTQALDKFSATFETGHIYGLIGRNGAGKSTFLNILTDRVYLDSGCVKMDDKTTSENPQTLAHLKHGVIEMDGLNVKNNTKELAKIHLMNDANYYFDDEKCGTMIKWAAELVPTFDKEKALALADRFSLNLKKTYKGQSTGNRTIFKDIMALSMNVPFIFFDEPTLGLDAVARTIFYNEVATLLAENEDVCIVLSTHLIEEIEPLVDRFYMIQDGKNLLSGDKDEVLSAISVVRGRKEQVEEAIQNSKVLAHTTVLGSNEAVVEGDVVQSEEVEVLKPSLQELFVRLVGGENA